VASILQKRLKLVSRISDFALLGTDGLFYVFGDPEYATGCMYADGYLPHKVKKEQVVSTKKEPKDVKWIVNTSENIDYLLDKATQIHKIKNNLITSFNLSETKWKTLNERIYKDDVSHFQIECNGKDIRAYCFDVRSTIGSSNYKPTWVSGANGLYVKVGKIPFKISIDVAAWKKLPIENVVVKLFDNGIMRLEYIDDGIRISIRDQEIRRPHTAFYSERMKKRVLFLFHPKKGTLVKEDVLETEVDETNNGLEDNI
jgi:hypothetical protein